MNSFHPKLFWSWCFQHGTSITFIISQSSGLTDSLVASPHPHPQWCVCHAGDMPSSHRLHYSAPGLQGCDGEASLGHRHHEKFISWTLPAPNLYLVFPFVLASSLLYFIPLFKPLKPVTALSSFLADDLPTNCLWDFFSSSFF